MHPWQKVFGNLEPAEPPPRTDPYDSSRLQISDVRSRIEPDEHHDDIKPDEGSDRKECHHPYHEPMFPIYQMRKPFITGSFSSEMDVYESDHLPVVTLSTARYEVAEAEWETEDEDKKRCKSVTRSASDPSETPPLGPSRRRAALAGETRTKVALAFEETVIESPSYFRKQKMKAAAAGKPWPNSKKSAKSQKQSAKAAHSVGSDSEDAILNGITVDEEELELQGTKRPFWCHVCGTRFIHIDSLLPHYKTDDHLLKRELVGMGDVADQEYYHRQRKLRPFQCTICKIQFLEYPVLQDHFNEMHKKRRAQSREPLEQGKLDTTLTIVAPVRIRAESQSQVLQPPQTPPEEVVEIEPPQQPVSSKGSRASNHTRRNGKANSAKRTNIPVDSDDDSWGAKQSTSKGCSSKHRSSRDMGEGPYKCDPCKVAFNRIADLKRHFGTDRHCFKKTGVRARRGITCTICGTAFTRLDAAYRHVQRSHTHEFKVYGGDIIQQADPDGDSSS